MTEERHFNNACNFRSLISRHSYNLLQELEREQAKHEDRLQRIERFVREEEVKKINRDRIKKILEFESSQTWLHGDKINEQIISEWVLPKYIGSTEYYHKLHTQALAYDQLNLDLLHKLSSDEEAIEYKNKLLIPIYKELLVLMKDAKFTEEEKLQKSYENQIAHLFLQFKSTPDKLTQELEVLEAKHKKSLEDLAQSRTPENAKKQLLKDVEKLAFVFKKWKEYTDVLGLTSNEIYATISK